MRAIPKRAFLLALVVGVAVAVGAWFASDEATRAAITNAVGGKPAQTAAKAKPICASPVNPNVAAPVDCIPAHLANLPPDPGEAGKATIDGLCATTTGTLEPCDPEKHPERLRADVQRWIVTEWGHSPIAVVRLTIIAQQQLRAVHYGDSLGKKETYERFATESMRQSACASDLETPEMQAGDARDKLAAQVKNTKERKLQSHNFSYMFAGSVTPGFVGTAAEACGFDVDAMAKAEGKETITQQLTAEVAERAKREQAEEGKK